MKGISSLQLWVVMFAVIIPLNTFGEQPGGQQKEEEAQTRSFDHLNENRDTSFYMKLKDGEEFKIVINNTFPTKFTYDIAGFEFAEKKAEGQQFAPPPKEPLTKTISQRHEKRYGGYVLRIRRIGADPFVYNNIRLNDVQIIIVVETIDWDIAINGGFTASSLTDPVFEIVPNQEGQQVVVRNEDAEDKARLGLGAFVHAFRKDHPKFAWSFGIGIQDNNRTTYYMGPTFRFGDKAALTGGVALGSIARLPAGVREGAIAKDGNVLSTLGSRVSWGGFVALTYSFIKVSDLIEKPIKGQTDGGTKESQGKQASAGPSKKCQGISGSVITDQEGKPLSDVDISYEVDGKKNSTKTNQAGEFNITGEAGTYKISAAKEGYVFEPAEAEVKCSEDEEKTQQFKAKKKA